MKQADSLNTGNALHDMVETSPSIQPLGKDGDSEGGRSIRELCHDKLSQQQAETLFRAVRFLLYSAKDKSEARLKESIAYRADGVLTQDELHSIYQFITGDAGEPYGGGDGSEDNPVVIKHTGSIKGIEAEMTYLSDKYGQKDKDWFEVLCWAELHATRQLDCIDIKLADGSRHLVYFEISNFFGRF